MNRLRRRRHSMTSVTLLATTVLGAYLLNDSVRAFQPAVAETTPNRVAHPRDEASDRTVIPDSCLRLLTQPIATARPGLLSPLYALNSPAAVLRHDREFEPAAKISDLRRPSLLHSVRLAQNRIDKAPALLSASAQTT